MIRTLLLGTAGTLLLAGCLPKVVEPDDPPGPSSEPAAEQTPSVTEPPTTAEPGGQSGQGGQGGQGTSGTSGTNTPMPDDEGDPDRAAAARFLVQASFGPAPSDIDEVMETDFAGWIAKQSALPVPSLTSRVLQTPDANRHTLTDLFWSHAIDGEDQLRQRVAYALSQIVVASLRHDHYWSHPEIFASYMDVLQREALGNYLDLIQEVSVNPAMGMYLSSLGNQRGENGAAPDENYAREVMQLFTIGLEELNPDGTPRGRETYTIEDIRGLASVFTGLSYANTGFRWPDFDQADKTGAMVSHDAFHESAPKTFLGTTIDVGSDARASVRAALDHLLAHDNVAPFVGKQLIQRLVTSNPSPAYVARVSAAFEAGRHEADGYAFGEGRRGDMTATVAAILLDEEARDERFAARPEHGKVREPAMRVAQFLRAFRDDARTPQRGAPAEAGRLRSADRLWVLGQQPYNPDSVFGFTRPGYVAPSGWTAQAGLVAPQLSLAGGAQTVSYINFMGWAVEGRPDRLPSYQPDYADLRPLTDDPNALVGALDRLLTYGTLSDATRERIVQAVHAVRIDEREAEADRERRLQLAVLMMVTSAEYGVLR